ncbi:hypothetical protein GZ77_12735 [Endozoicomonas montiporae]|uniref:DUF3426 domain-containing protein n=1 Tax=Endozoicomonas montiporae TaxID=1027273 RepID=A0A081N4C2_9GAMM|nr:hypothetical protein GZ77_12735 [Endozoicomonas montiporae]
MNIFNAGKDVDSEPESIIENKQTKALTSDAETSKPEQSQDEVTASPTTGQSSSTLNSLLKKVDKEQVEIRHERRTKRSKISKKRLLQYSVVLSACLTLGFQYLWFNKDELSLNPAIRPYLQSVCKTLNCTLPPVVNISEIQSSQLLVRIHPDNEQMMVVDAVIVNQASHPQPWPKLSLAFTDLQDQPVASRTFSPKEYLGGELAGTKEMPANQAIRLSLELLDPGPDAVNYRLTFKRKTR